MNKQEFLMRLDRFLYELPLQNKNNVLAYYNDLIDAAVYEGNDEREYIDSLGFIPGIAKNIVTNYFLANPRPEKNRTLKLVALMIAFPVSLLACAVAILLLAAEVLLGLFLFVLGLFFVFGSMVIMVESFMTGLFFVGLALLMLGGSIYLTVCSVTLMFFFCKAESTFAQFIKKYKNKEVCLYVH